MGKGHHCEEKNCGKCARGPQGLPGYAGPTGPQGLNGQNGTDGPVGPQGLKGPTGPAGQVTFAGPTGPQGLQGLSGQQGNNGQNGENGLNGPPGAQGPEGPTGPTGPAGPPGPPGNAVQFLAGRGGSSEIASFTKVATNFSSVILAKVGLYNLRFRVRSNNEIKMTLNKEALSNDAVYTITTVNGQVHIGDLIVKNTEKNGVFMIQGNANFEVENMIVISLN